jgi:hypothetical protein
MCRSFSGFFPLVLVLLVFSAPAFRVGSQASPSRRLSGGRKDRLGL